MLHFTIKATGFQYKSERQSELDHQTALKFQNINSQMLWWFWMDQQQISETFMVWLQDIKYCRRVRKAYLSWEFYLNHGIIWLGVTTRATNLNFLSRITWFLFRLNTVSWFVALWGCNSICRVLHFSWNRKQKAIVCQGFIRANQVIYSCTDKSMWKKKKYGLT